ncbi:nucleotidyltransferase family protein [Brachybacterium massiliense]|uniref:nucleotidyltransferase family protein n=1 Tax=Brachybacterium massiliense TaxID=1755098 RepID=UPI0014832E3B|nr:nucleotidyltransferase family protein [Brachybacterium massiliense]
MLELGYVPAITLVAAIVADRARRAGLRVLFIKGPFFTAQGVRDPKQSFDLDILLHPEDVDQLVELLAKDGWRLRDHPDAVLPFEEHSVTILHHFWPCTIDVHRFWLGFLQDAALTFERLWQYRERTAVGALAFDTPCYEDSAVLEALNEIRSGHRHEGTLAGIRQRVRGRLGEAAGCRLRERALQLGAELSAAPFLRPLGQHVSIPDAPGPAYAEWVKRLSAEDQSVTAWLLRLRDAPLRRRPGMVVDALALRPSQLRALRPDARPGFRGFLEAWTTRARKGSRDMCRYIVRERRRGTGRRTVTNRTDTRRPEHGEEVL